MIASPHRLLIPVCRTRYIVSFRQAARNFRRIRHFTPYLGQGKRAAVPLHGLPSRSVWIRKALRGEDTLIGQRGQKREDIPTFLR